MTPTYCMKKVEFCMGRKGNYYMHILTCQCTCSHQHICSLALVCVLFFFFFDKLLDMFFVNAHFYFVQCYL